MNLKTSIFKTLTGKYVSFDVFDTLIKRSVAKPTDLFLLMEKYLAYVRPEIPAGFAEKRRLAEHRASQRVGRPVGIREIYNILRCEFGEYTDELMALEMQMELGGCRPNPKCVELFERCVAAGKTVVLISDMYLPSETIAEMLEKCGVRGYKKLYVSCECGARKGDGSLFKIVINELMIRPWQLVHIGDSKGGDVLAPLQMGIRAIWKRNDQKKMCKVLKTIPPENALAYRTMQTCIRNCSQGMLEYERIGCVVFGPILYGFTQWLIAKLREDGINNVYFLSRDGYMLMRAFEEFELPDIKIQYLYCSRRSYLVPLMWKHPEFDDVTQTLFLGKGNMTVRGLMLRFGLDPDKYIERAESFSLEMDKIYSQGSIYTSNAVRRFYESIKQDVIENSKNEYRALVTYIKTLSLSSKIAVVDIGWHGSMQYALEELIREENLNTAVKGYYVGINAENSAIVSGKIEAEGYLFDANRHEGEAVKRRSAALFEAQFLASHGSVKRFVLMGGVAKPEFEDYEYAKNSSQIIDESVVIGEYQNGAINFVRYMRNVYPENTVMIHAGTALSGFSRLINRPTFREANMLGDIRCSNYQVIFYCARPKSVLRYVMHPKEFKRDYCNSGWPIGFLRRLFLLPLPYDKIHDVMKKVYYKI